MTAEKMGSRELGLVLAQQLFDVEDLHYGVWDPDLPLTIGNLKEAQARHSRLILDQLPTPAAGVRVLDIGCGTGALMHQMLELGYLADGLVPAPYLAAQARARAAAARSDHRPTIFEMRLEDLDAEAHRHRYDVAVFSESFQYVPVDRALEILQAIVKPGGRVVICDFFKTAAHGDGGPGDGSFGGGHPLAEFYTEIAAAPLTVLVDLDITARMSPNLRLVNDVLMGRLLPALLSCRRYLEGRYPRLLRFLLWLGRRKIARARFKYFSGYRSPEVFERYKSYRLLVYRMK